MRVSGVPPCALLDPNQANFEDGAFPLPPWSTGGAGNWALSTDKAYTGTTSIKSPDFNGAGSSISNVTLEICDNFIGGSLHFWVLASVVPPHDIFMVYIDGEAAAQLVDINEWAEIDLQLEAGAHKVDFSYQYNMFQLDALPLSPPQRQGKCGN